MALAQEIEDGLMLFEEFDPVLAGVPWIGPLLPFINHLLPAAIKAVDIVAKSTGDVPVSAIAVEGPEAPVTAATQVVINHLTPGKPNAPALGPKPAAA